MDDDSTLLRRFAREGAQDAFAELVRRKAPLVYGTALRRVGGDAHLAEDVTQTVFLALANRATSLGHHTLLSGWLYTATCLLASKAVRSQVRWQRRESEATKMTMSSPSIPTGWDDLRDVIDAAMEELSPADRDALVLRYFEGKPLAEVGHALGLAENAARMRVDRALEKLRRPLARRGIVSTAAAIGTALSAQPVAVLPEAFVSRLTAYRFLGDGLAGSGVGWQLARIGTFMATNQAILTSVALCVGLGIGSLLGAQFSTLPTKPTANTSTEFAATMESLRKENLRLKTELAQRPSIRANPATTPPVSAAIADAVPIEQLRVLADLSRRRLVFPMVKVFNYSDRNIARSFAQLFALSEAETIKLQQAVDDGRSRLSDLERQNASIERRADGSAVITIKPFAESGGAVYDDVMKNIATVLGPERQSAFAELCAKEVEKSLGWFGVADRKITVTPQATATGTRYSVLLEHRLPTESGSSGSEFDSYDKLAAYLGPTSQLLPSEWRQ